LAKIALLVDEPLVSKYVKELAEWVVAQDDLELAALVVHPAPQTERRGVAKLWLLARQQGLVTLLSRIAFAILFRIEKRLFLHAPAYREHGARFDIAGMAERIVRTAPIVSKSGFVYRFSDADLAAVRAVEADVLVRCGNGILKGGILSAATHGVVSMHHADNRVNRGGPAGFWEVYKRQPETGFIVQRLTEELDGGAVLFRGSISTDAVFVRNQANLYARSNLCLMRTLRALCEGRCAEEEPHIYDDRLYRTPSLGVSLAYGAKTLGFFLRKAVRRIAGRRWRWGVAYQSGGWREAILWRAKPIPNPAGHFLADPFACEWQGRRFILVEDYIEAKKKGVISTYEIDDRGKAARLGISLEEPFHLSFPFVFRFGDALFMVPESSAVRQIRLYRCEGDPARWVFDRVLVDGVNAVDTMIFELGGRWWMLTTINEAEVGPNDAELFLFAAASPLGPWERQGDGPLFVDAGRGRNGGLLSDGETLYRVAQRHGFAEYGRSATVYRFTIGPDGYEETKVQEVNPRFAAGVRGLHHLHHAASLFVFDYRRSERMGSGQRA
jgi:hypothetical protein